MRFSALFEEVFGETALSSLTLERNFSGVSLPGFLTSPAKSYREDAGNGVTVFRPYPGQDYQTICRCHSQVAAHSP